MSVYIKGMEMPHNCDECRLCAFIPVGDYGLYRKCLPLNAKAKITIRRADCPLLPVPDHGRLIDADFIVKRLRKQIQDVGADTELANRGREFISIIGAVSTIIPADKEEREC